MVNDLCVLFRNFYAPFDEFLYRLFSRMALKCTNGMKRAVTRSRMEVLYFETVPTGRDDVIASVFLFCLLVP